MQYGKKNKLGFALLLKYFQLEGHYPKHTKYIDPFMLDCIANQLNIRPSVIDNYDWEGRSTERHRQEVRNLLGYREAKPSDAKNIKLWLESEIFPRITKPSEFIEYTYEYFRKNHIEPFSSSKLERYINSAYSHFEKALFNSIYQELPKATMDLMTELLVDVDESIDDIANDAQSPQENATIKFKDLKKDVPGAKLKHVNHEINKMQTMAQLNLPKEFLGTLSRNLVKKYYQRIMAEPPSSIISHEPSIRYATFTLFCYYRSQLIIDNAVDLFIQLVHRMQTSAEKFITKQIISDVKRVNGKFDILYSLANTALQNPEGVIQEKIYPEVSKETLSNVVHDLDHKGKWYNNQVNTKIRSLYSHASRKTLLILFDSFQFKTNLPESKLLLDALETIKKYRHSKDKCYPKSVTMTIDKLISKDWLHLILDVQSNDGENITQINRINYEIAVLQILCKQLNCKMIWVEGASRYQNPDKELPQDFDERREYYYEKVGLPLDVHEFVNPSKSKLHSKLSNLNSQITANKKVKITDKNGGHIKISPSEPQAEPPNIKKLHRAIRQEWSMTNLIDILKETDLQVGFTKQFHTVASRESLPEETLQQRLLLCLYGIGTNTGLKPISAANGEVTYSDLRYVKRRFITPENVRAGIVDIVNRILAIRDPRIWGEATTGVACDSKKLSVWDQNLMVEWHARYKGRGVMVYWHVDKQSLCIHSQLKTCSSSEVGSMIKGVLQHCTDMMIDKAYMDTHGQSTIGFGVSELLGFNLLPRLKNIHKQKLYYPSAANKNDYEKLKDILKGPIDWKLIEENYDEAVKHIVALKLNMLDPDVFIKRFSNDNYQHPVYRPGSNRGYTLIA